ncbi:hypothetical protein AB3M83_00445 [Microbacterium sp. 179-B 1A2 NHS]|uniref:hypothetical protein n=1 Tax=Microbacterium sp. 179-B 1A2 NHS TaxID=3142383 RepID=UPI0039A2F6E3
MPLSALTRSWPTLAAWGAGLLEMGLGAGALTQGSSAAARGTGILLVTAGAAALLWGVVALAKARVVAPRSGALSAIAGLVGATAALIVDPGRISALAVAVIVLLSLVYGVAAAAVLRRAARGGSAPAAAPSDATDQTPARTVPRTSMLGLVAGCVVVAGLVTPALGSTAVGSDAPDHSEHRLILPGHGH